MMTRSDPRMPMERRAFLKVAGLAAATACGAFVLSGCRSELGDEIFRSTRTITDDAGRTLTVPIPDALQRIYYTSPLGQIYVFSLDPAKMGGTATQYTQAQLEYLPARMADLVYMGSLATGTIDREMLVRSDIQLIFSVSGVELTASNISEAEKLQQQTGIPVVLVDGSFDHVASAYRLMGDIMGCPDRAEEVAVYLEGIYGGVTEAVAGIPEQDKVSFYYAEGPLGLSTEPSSSQHAKAFEVAGGRNVANVEEMPTALGMSAVSLEDVIVWDPQVIICWDETQRGGAASVITSSPAWAGIAAVRDGRVYQMPNLPFAWCDRPPGVNRFLGIEWLANLFYPQRYQVDMVERAREFFRVVYRIEATDEQIRTMLGNSYDAAAGSGEAVPAADADEEGEKE